MSIDNNIPIDWVETTLGEVCFFVNDKISISKINLDNYISTENLLANRQGVTIASSLPKTSKVNNYKKGDTLFSNIRTYFKKVWFCSKEGGSSNDVLIFRPVDKNTLFDKFLFYYISSDKFIDFTVKSAKGTKMPRGDKNAITNSPFNLPPLPEQTAIAKILTAFDDKIELLQAQNKTLETTAQTIFKEWFGKYQIGDELPDGWRVGKLGEVVEKSNTGADAIKKAPIVEYDTGIRCLRIGDLSNNRAFEQWGFSKVTDKNFKQFQLKKFNILITRTSILGLNMLIMEDLNSVYNNGLIKISLNKSINPFFIYGYFRSKYYKDYINMINNDTSTRPNMKIDYLLKFPILFPVKELETKFSDIMESILKKISDNTSQIQTLKQTRDTLLPKLMSGTLRVNEFKETAV